MHRISWVVVVVTSGCYSCHGRFLIVELYWLPHRSTGLLPYHTDHTSICTAVLAPESYMCFDEKFAFCRYFAASMACVADSCRAMNWKWVPLYCCAVEECLPPPYFALRRLAWNGGYSLCRVAELRFTFTSCTTARPCSLPTLPTGSTLTTHCIKLTNSTHHRTVLPLRTWPNQPHKLDIGHGIAARVVRRRGSDNQSLVSLGDYLAGQRHVCYLYPVTAVSVDMDCGSIIPVSACAWCCACVRRTNDKPNPNNNNNNNHRRYHQTTTTATNAAQGTISLIRHYYQKQWKDQKIVSSYGTTSNSQGERVDTWSTDSQDTSAATSRGRTCGELLCRTRCLLLVAILDDSMSCHRNCTSPVPLAYCWASYDAHQPVAKCSCRITTGLLPLDLWHVLDPDIDGVIRCWFATKLYGTTVTILNQESITRGPKSLPYNFPLDILRTMGNSSRKD